ncbi:MAG: 50S ribosomal protein L25 [Anaerolineae bacterium]|nr:50S ribosomal protein L25 [Anaerolineae bacterium]
MDALELKAEVRETTGRHVKYLRRDGLVPAVVYGRGAKSTLLQIDAKLLRKVLNEAGTHQLIALQVGKQKPMMTLARDIQRDYIKHNYLHVDFYAVKMDEKVTAQVPLVIEGTSPAVRDHGGVLTQGLDEIEIECLPGDLISAIAVNVEELIEINDSITVAELKVPSSITILSDPDSMVVKVEPPRMVEEVEAELEEVAAVGAEPEVISKPKAEEAEEE